MIYFIRNFYLRRTKPYSKSSFDERKIGLIPFFNESCLPKKTVNLGASEPRITPVHTFF
jgi:hypothetical protein